MITVTLSLVSHTNVGKTTLARTLLRRDVGEVLDQPHVTEVSEAHVLIETDEARLQLWDTPGLGDTLRLLERLRRERNPVGWFLHQVWDRTLNRPLWCSQEALRNVREDADVVLYLVNATEAPEDAGYVEPELEILAWIGRPTLVLLNQTGEAGARSEGLVEAWRRALARHRIVRGFLTLDAFTRCWRQENVLLDRIVYLLDGAKERAMAELSDAWRRRNLEVLARSVELMAEGLVTAAMDREPLGSALASASRKQEAMAALGERLAAHEARQWDAVIEAHGLEGSWASEVRDNLDAFVVSGEPVLTRERGALLGGVVSGAVGGLTADLLAGGLSFGGGMLAGAILGALGGAGLSQAVQLLGGREAPAVSWSPALLDELVERSLLRYLAVAHSGRGRGPVDGEAESDTWRAAVRRELEERRALFARRWKTAATADASRAELERALAADLRGAIEALLDRAYGGAQGSERSG